MLRSTFEHLGRRNFGAQPLDYKRSRDISSFQLEFNVVRGSKVGSRRQSTSRSSPSHQLLPQTDEDLSWQRLCEQVGQLFLSIDLLDEDRILTFFPEVGPEPMHFAVIELGSWGVLTRIEIRESKASHVVLPNGDLEISLDLLIDIEALGDCSH